jgi:hypothetical protein
MNWDKGVSSARRGAVGLDGITPCSIKGVAENAPKRWQSGHIRLAKDRLLWWRHLSRRRRPLVFRPDRLTIVGYRKVGKLEGWSVNRKCTIVICDESPSGRAEFAFINPADAEQFAALLGGPSPPT